MRSLPCKGFEKNVLNEEMAPSKVSEAQKCLLHLRDKKEPNGDK